MPGPRSSGEDACVRQDRADVSRQPFCIGQAEDDTLQDEAVQQRHDDPGKAPRPTAPPPRQYPASTCGGVPRDELPEAAGAQMPAHDDELWQQVRPLRERQRTAIVLHYVLGLPHGQVGEQMGTTALASRRLVSDGLRTLRAHLGHRDGLEQKQPCP